jgi:hypothetical protein
LDFNMRHKTIRLCAVKWAKQKWSCWLLWQFSYLRKIKIKCTHLFCVCSNRKTKLIF